MKKFFIFFLLVLAGVVFVFADSPDMDDVILQKIIKRAPHFESTLKAHLCRISHSEIKAPLLKTLQRELSFYSKDLNQDSLYTAIFGESNIPGPTMNDKLLESNSRASSVDDAQADCWNVNIATSRVSENILAVWQDGRDGVENPDIYGQLLDANLSKIGSNFKIHTDDNAAQTNPVVAPMQGGGFVVAWQDYRNDASQIFVRYFSESMNPGAQERVLTSSTNDQLEPDLVISSQGTCFLTWLAEEESDYNVYGCAFEIKDQFSLLTGKIAINEAQASLQWFPHIACSTEDLVFISWEDYRDGNANIYGQFLSITGQKKGSNLKVNYNVDAGLQWRTANASSDNNFYVIWQSFTNNGNFLYGAKFEGLVKTVQEKKLATITNSDELCDITINGNGETAVCWQDSKEGIENIYVKVFDDVLTPLKNRRVTNGGDGDTFSSPRILEQSDTAYFFWVQNDDAGGTQGVYSHQLRWAELPVELSSFTAKYQKRKVFLEWTCLSEANNYGFTVQKSPDGDTFSDVGFLRGKNTVQGRTCYDFVDHNISFGTIYYRLKQTDFDGQETYSDVISVFVNEKNAPAVRAFPNPFNSTVQVEFYLENPTDAQVKIYNLTGNVVYENTLSELGKGHHNFRWQGRSTNNRPCASGSYFISIRTADGRYQTRVSLNR